MKTPNAFPKEKPGEFPFRAGKSNASVTMYRTVTRGYDEYKIPFLENGARKFHRFANYESARVKANEMIEQISAGQGEAIMLTSADRAAYLRATEALKPLGIALEIAALQYAECVKLLGNVSPVEAARSYVKRYPADMPDKSVAVVVDEFIKAKKDGKRSTRYVEDLNYRLGKFKNDFNVSIANVDGVKLRGFLDGLNLSPRSYNNFRSTLISLFEFAKRRKYLPGDWNEFDGIDTVKDNGGAIEIFTPEDLAELLAKADEQLVPFLTIGAFAGLRSAEIDRLDWRDVKFSTGYIVIEKGKAKTASRRVVPMPDNLKEWLQPYAKTRGKVWPHSHAYLYEALKDTATNAKVDWKPNALRHSFISYRVADTGDVNRTALEAGNSPAVIFSNYREIVTGEDAKRWFSIRPGTEKGKIIFLKAA